jgi:hypothetical protein
MGRRRRLPHADLAGHRPPVARRQGVAGEPDLAPGPALLVQGTSSWRSRSAVALGSAAGSRARARALARSAPGQDVRGRGAGHPRVLPPDRCPRPLRGHRLRSPLA